MPVPGHEDSLTWWLKRSRLGSMQLSTCSVSATSTSTAMCRAPSSARSSKGNVQSTCRFSSCLNKMQKSPLPNPQCRGMSAPRRDTVKSTTTCSTTHLQSPANAACHDLHKSSLAKPQQLTAGCAHLPRKEVSQLLSTRVDKSLTKGLSAVGLAAMCAEPAAAHAISPAVAVTAFQLLQHLGVHTLPDGPHASQSKPPFAQQIMPQVWPQWGRLAVAYVPTSCSVWC